MRASYAAVCLALAGPTLACLARAQTTPKPGSKERTAILDGIRPTIQKDLGQKVIFRVEHMKATKEWAFVYGAPLQPNGKPIDYKKTKYRHEFVEGAFDDNFCALLKRSGGKWKPVAWLVGMTDVGWEGWWTKHRAPRSIFPK